MGFDKNWTSSKHCVAHCVLLSARICPRTFAHHMHKLGFVSSACLCFTWAVMTSSNVAASFARLRTLYLCKYTLKLLVLHGRQHADLRGQPTYRSSPSQNPFFSLPHSLVSQGVGLARPYISICVCICVSIFKYIYTYIKINFV